MIEDDFLHLRTAARESLIGRSLAWLWTAISNAASDAIVSRRIGAVVSRYQEEDPDERVRWAAITLAVAAAAGFALSRIVPPYLGTLIPSSGYLIGLAIFTAAAVVPHAVVGQWRKSRLRRFTQWLQE
jgi:hypothetical protein